MLLVFNICCLEATEIGRYMIYGNVNCLAITVRDIQPGDGQTGIGLLVTSSGFYDLKPRYTYNLYLLI